MRRVLTRRRTGETPDGKDTAWWRRGGGEAGGNGTGILEAERGKCRRSRVLKRVGAGNYHRWGRRHGNKETRRPQVKEPADWLTQEDLSLFLLDVKQLFGWT